MAIKKGYLKQKTGTSSSDILLPHTSSDIVALSSNITVSGSTKTNVQDALTAINTLANNGGSHASTDLDANNDPHNIKDFLDSHVWNVGSAPTDGETLRIIEGYTNGGGKYIGHWSDYSISDIIAVAEGRTKTWVVNKDLNSTLNVATTSSTSSVSVTSLKTGTTSPGTEVIGSVHVGDVVLLTNTDVADWWVGSVTTSGSTTTATLYRLETMKHDLSGYVQTSRTVTGTGALGGGGALSSNQTITHAELNTSGAKTTAGIFKVKLDKYGHVTEATAIQKSDLTALGVSGNTGFKVSSGTNAGGSTIIQEGFTQDGGTIALADSGVTAGTYSAVQVNSAGIVIAGAQFFQVVANGGSTSGLATGGLYFEQDAA